jgi:hypothetical protein
MELPKDFYRYDMIICTLKEVLPKPPKGINLWKSVKNRTIRTD